MPVVTVPAGSSLWQLAQRYLGDGRRWPEIEQANPQLRPDPNLVLAGQRIVIPAPAAPPQRSDAALALLAAGVLASALSSDDATVALNSAFLAAGVPPPALTAALIVVMEWPKDRLEGIGDAQRNVIKQMALRRAQFLVASAKRLAGDVRAARSSGTPLRQALAAGVQRERRYFNQHMAAQQGRSLAASRADGAAAMYGPLLGWYTVNDSRTSAECRAANGKNFYVGSMPLIGYPGMVHPACRCAPGQPHSGAQILPSTRMKVAA